MADVISTPMLSRRALVFLGIVALHVGFVYVLNAGLAEQAVETVFGPIETKMIEEVTEEEDKPPPPPPKIETAPPPFVPPPDISIDLPVETTTTTAITATTQKPVAKPPPPAAVVRVPPKQNPRRPMPISTEDYPPQSRRLGEEGVTIVRLYVLADGSIGDVQVATSSGFPRLDETAVKKLKRWRVNPGTENGKPVPMWMDLRVVWKITK
jgi:protein TonB